MKRLTTLLLALVVVLFTQCKKDNLDNTDTNTDTDVRKVKVRCEIPLGDGTRSDFTNLMTDGSIKWSTGTERIYLAVHHDTKAQIVELTAETTQTATILAFEGEVDEEILAAGETYNVWYFGNSQNLGEDSYVTKTGPDGVITSVSGSIANQSGSLEDLGYHHIAKAEVKATLESDGSYTLPLHGTLQNQIAIAYMDLTDVNYLSGNAIIGTDYSLEYSDGKYEFVINENNNEISITPNQSESSSYIVLLPNSNTNVDITKDNNVLLQNTYTFKDGIAASSFYYRYISDVEIGTLKWGKHSSLSCYEFVDLGLPSGLKWATCNVGASAPEEYGNYYAWGMTTPHTEESTFYDGREDITGDAQHDAATANWGVACKMPTKAQMNELKEYCEWEWTAQNGVNGYNVTSKTNGNSIFLPAAGYRSGSSLDYAGEYGFYWSSTPYESYSSNAYYLYFDSSDQVVDWFYRFGGLSVRPVSE